MMVPSRKPTYSFDTNGKYVIFGGLRGLGRSIARWMARRGARYLFLLSRSGAKRATGQQLVAELSAMGIKIATPACEVTNKGDSVHAIKFCLEDMPVIKGCIQGSMVLKVLFLIVTHSGADLVSKDGIFENLSLEDSRTVLRPKVQGTYDRAVSGEQSNIILASWNLHEVLPKDVDFFILLSSASGIVGNRGQSNYSAGNSYQDGLARYRVSQEWKATALDLGVILSVGVVAENAGLLGNL